ncbi:hypothetical protein B6N60_01873 [Richelia sinica FACHB-800]|uniref:Uncharacterized protein n=1 Tax=Richelia sinica FACHB-800 TaxID=1357546 RepID=A0A975T6Y9_9NOST|nr:hypothetical protein [Richelia sinica]MBD2664714.1 hypothetical protein [Richelia sinica FACHB-800]QXE23184.1 hypothetical protein B6N60_01873 [Richelia sinica FACHB-800]
MNKHFQLDGEIIPRFSLYNRWLMFMWQELDKNQNLPSKIKLPAYT